MMLFERLNYNNIDFTKEPLAKGEYEGCKFINCTFSNLDVSYFTFIECSFCGCDLSLVKIHQVLLRDIKFIDSKMIGLQFGTTNTFGLAASFENCILTNSSFYKTKIKQTIFANSKVNEVDFTECDLSGSVFDNCDLSNAIFDLTNLEKVDFRTSYNYSIDVDRNKIKKSKHTSSQLGGLLEKYNLIVE
jgi:fluoroquinolone resistance protein